MWTLLFKELDEYGHGMLEKPSVLALNKIDTDTSGRAADKLMDLISNLPGIFSFTLLIYYFSVWRMLCVEKSVCDYSAW